MNIEILNRYLALSWVLITIGACILNIGAGLIVSGIVLLCLTLFMARFAGVYSAKSETESKAS